LHFWVLAAEAVDFAKEHLQVLEEQEAASGAGRGRQEEAGDLMQELEASMRAPEASLVVPLASVAEVVLHGLRLSEAAEGDFWEARSPTFRPFHFRPWEEVEAGGCQIRLKPRPPLICREMSPRLYRNLSLVVLVVVVPFFHQPGHS
jgi:hypothetical protein